MSDPVIRRVKRAVEDALNVGGMVCGMPKVRLDAADAERICLMAEGLQSELTAARDEAERLRSELETVHEAFGIGNKSRSLSVLMTNIENVKRFAEYLHAVERKFFMVPGEPDEDYPGCEPEDECLVNSWGSTKDRYLKQFEAAILRKQAEAVEAFGATTWTSANRDSRYWLGKVNDYAQRMSPQGAAPDMGGEK